MSTTTTNNRKPTDTAGFPPAPPEAHQRAAATPQFNVGDVVTYTNDYGMRWTGKTITGIEYWDGDDRPRYFYTPTDAPWFSVREASLSLESTAS